MMFGLAIAARISVTKTTTNSSISETPRWAVRLLNSVFMAGS
jgi:hypothetical protein